MAEVAEAHYLDRDPAGAARGRGGDAARLWPSDRHRRGHRGRPSRPRCGEPCRGGTRLALAAGAAAGDLVLVLMSGGASANWIAPVAGLTLAEKQAVNRALLKSGAGIGDINTVRKHLSRIKGGRLARRAHPAAVATLAISDVPGDDPAVIGSGPTVPDPTTLADARAVVARFKLALAEPVRRALADPANKSPKPGDPVFGDTSFRSRRPPGRCVSRRRGRRARRAATTASSSATASRARPARSPPPMAEVAREPPGPGPAGGRAVGG